MTSLTDVIKTESTTRAGALVLEGAGAFTFLVGVGSAIYSRRADYLVKGIAGGVMLAGAALITTAVADLQEAPLTEDNKINSAGYILLGSGAIIGALPVGLTLDTFPDMNDQRMIIVESISAVLLAAGTGTVVYRIVKK
jgi:hypothetical protein